MALETHVLPGNDEYVLGGRWLLWFGDKGDVAMLASRSKENVMDTGPVWWELWNVWWAGHFVPPQESTTALDDISPGPGRSRGSGTDNARRASTEAGFVPGAAPGEMEPPLLVGERTMAELTAAKPASQGVEMARRKPMGSPSQQKPRTLPPIKPRSPLNPITAMRRLSGVPLPDDRARKYSLGGDEVIAPVDGMLSDVMTAGDASRDSPAEEVMQRPMLASLRAIRRGSALEPLAVVPPKVMPLIGRRQSQEQPDEEHVRAAVASAAGATLMQSYRKGGIDIKAAAGASAAAPPSAPPAEEKFTISVIPNEAAPAAARVDSAPPPSTDRQYSETPSLHIAPLEALRPIRRGSFVLPPVHTTLPRGVLPSVAPGDPVAIVPAAHDPGSPSALQATFDGDDVMPADEPQQEPAASPRHLGANIDDLRSTSPVSEAPSEPLVPVPPVKPYPAPGLLSSVRAAAVGGGASRTPQNVYDMQKSRAAASTAADAAVAAGLASRAPALAHRRVVVPAQSAAVSDATGAPDVPLEAAASDVSMQVDTLKDLPPAAASDPLSAAPAPNAAGAPAFTPLPPPRSVPTASSPVFVPVPPRRGPPALSHAPPPREQPDQLVVTDSEPASMLAPVFVPAPPPRQQESESTWMTGAAFAPEPPQRKAELVVTDSEPSLMAIPAFTPRPPPRREAELVVTDSEPASMTLADFAPVPPPRRQPDHFIVTDSAPSLIAPTQPTSVRHPSPRGRTLRLAGASAPALPDKEEPALQNHLLGVGTGEAGDEEPATDLSDDIIAVRPAAAFAASSASAPAMDTEVGGLGDDEEEATELEPPMAASAASVAPEDAEEDGEAEAALDRAEGLEPLPTICLDAGAPFIVPLLSSPGSLELLSALPAGVSFDAALGVLSGTLADDCEPFVVEVLREVGDDVEIARFRVWPTSSKARAVGRSPRRPPRSALRLADHPHVWNALGWMRESQRQHVGPRIGHRDLNWNAESRVRSSAVLFVSTQLLTARNRTDCVALGRRPTGTRAAARRGAQT